MTVMTSRYEGGLRCRSVHLGSDRELLTDAPLDNQGRGESFSPTDLVATALASCMMTVLGIAATWQLAVYGFVILLAVVVDAIIQRELRRASTGE